jgi:hypothetical protein
MRDARPFGLRRVHKMPRIATPSSRSASSRRWLARLAAGVLGLALLAGAAIASADPAVVQPAPSPAPASAPTNPAPQTSATTGAHASAANSASFNLLDLQTWPDALNPHKWPFTLFPVPEVATDPNSGVTYGMLFAFLFKDKHDNIDYILAPDINNNTVLGPGGNFRLFGYPSEDTQWYVQTGASQHIARDVDLSYQTGRTLQKWWSLNVRFFYEQDPTDRFFGLGNQSPERDQTNYTDEQVFLQVLFGWNLTRHLQLGFFSRPRYMRIKEGAFKTLPSIFELFPKVKGINGGSEFYNEARVTYDTRDSVDIPRNGTLAVLFNGVADRAFLSSSSYDRFGGDLHEYIPIGKRFTFAGHVYLQYTPAGQETPFWAMPRLGGEESLLYDQQTLRGYGVGRFTDNNIADANFELRTRVLEATILGNHGILELAPFFDTGRVWNGMSTVPFEDLHSVAGMGFRAIAEPFVVGYLDIGYGGEGSAIFAGLNYPF